MSVPHRRSSSAPSSSHARRGGPARAIRDVLPGALRALGVAPKAVSRRIAAAWERASEGAWRGKAAPDRIQGGTLFVRVSAAPLRQELVQFHAARLLSVLNTLLPDDPIVALRFESGRVQLAADPADPAGAGGKGDRS